MKRLRFHRRWMSFDMLVGALIVVAFALAVISAIYEQANCLKWEDTDDVVCTGGDGYMRCRHDRQCVEWRDAP